MRGILTIAAASTALGCSPEPIVCVDDLGEAGARIGALYGYLVCASKGVCGASTQECYRETDERAKGAGCLDLLDLERCVEWTLWPGMCRDGDWAPRSPQWWGRCDDWRELFCVGGES